MVSLMVDVKELLDYNENVRHRYFETLAKLTWKEFTANREASFNSIRNIFVHALTAVDYWLDFLQEENLCSKKKYDDYVTFQEIKAYMASVEHRMHSYIDSLSTVELDKTYSVTDERGKKLCVTAEDVLIHVFEEEVHHRGELIALLWQINVEPPPMGWKEL